MNNFNLSSTNLSLYIFAFDKNISAQVMHEVHSQINYLITYKHLLSGQSSLSEYLNILLKKQPKYILGLGEYSGRDQSKIRIETIAKNRFRNSEILQNGANQMEIPCFLQPTMYSKFATALGNSWCNLVSYKITELIVSKKLNSKFIFLHIPKSLDINFATTTVVEMLHNYFRNYI